MVWRDGVVPDGSPPFPDSLSADLLDYGYAVLVLALELRDANLGPSNERFETTDALVVAAEAIESAIRRGNSEDLDYGRHLVVSAAAFHLAGYAARSYSLLPPSALDKNLASGERALAFLLRRDLVSLREQILTWLGRSEHGDDVVADRLADPDDDFGPDDALVLAFTTIYFRALGMADTALSTGEQGHFKDAIDALSKVVSMAGSAGNIPIWWVATLAIHLFRDLWDQSLHVQLPRGKGPNDNLPTLWDDLRNNFILQLAIRTPPHVDLWPSQLEAAKRSVDVTDDLVIALPTSAGKTKIAELCILRTLANEKRVVYVTPLRALSAQVERVLARTFVPLGATVSSLYGAIGASAVDNQALTDADVVVATPEKIDFALRQDPSVLDDVELVVFDEGHMIGLGSREIRYEVLIQRLLRRSDSANRRIICLSAMFNPGESYFNDFAAWLRRDAGRDPIHVEWRPTRRRMAELDWYPRSGAARLTFLEGEEAFVTRFVEREDPLGGRREHDFPKDEIEFCLAAAHAFARDGNAVLIYSPQRSQIDPLLATLITIRKQGYLSEFKVPQASDLAVALAIGSEWLGSDHKVVTALGMGVGAHHGALPRPFQNAVEDLLDGKRLPVVIASPTLAQGIDLSCGVLIFRSLTRFDSEERRHVPIPSAEFANVVGRAGRAYVDLDGIIVLPSFDPLSRARRHEQFEHLIAESRSQQLMSGIAHLVLELAQRIAAKLSVRSAELLEYVSNNQDLWADVRLVAEDDSSEEDEQLRTFDEYLADLDVALLSLIDPLDTPVEKLAVVLDEILNGSLWKRTLSHFKPSVLAWQREIVSSRARWLWSNTTAEQRKACFAAGLGSRAGTFLFKHIDELVTILVDLNAAIVATNVGDACALAIQFAERVGADSQFFVRSPPTAWREVLRKWVAGTAFGEILQGLGTREQQRTQAFVQDGVIFKFVWAAEAVRVQAMACGHARSAELGDGPMLALTHGVPSIPAALLCQAGYSSRVGAVWLTTKLAADFTDVGSMRRWLRENESVLSDEEFWEHDDHRLLWSRLATPEIGEYPRRWNRRTSKVSPRWRSDPPAEGVFVRVIASPNRSALVCSASLEPLGELDLGMNPIGAVLQGAVLPGGQLRIDYYGPN